MNPSTPGPGLKPTCPRCGYDLTGLQGKCPECGRSVQRFTNRVRDVVALANEHAIRLSRGGSRLQSWFMLGGEVHFIRPFHLLLGLATGPEGVGRGALLACGVDANELARAIERCAPRVSRGAFGSGVRLPLSLESAEVVDQAVEVAFGLEHDWVGTEHLLLALLDCPDTVCRGVLGDVESLRSGCRAFVLNNMKETGQSDSHRGGQ